MSGLDKETIYLYSSARARVLGFAPADVWRKQQGFRSNATVPLRDARAKIVHELCSMGATLSSIGEVFGGRNKAAVFDLARHGEELFQLIVHAHGREYRMPAWEGFSWEAHTSNGFIHTPGGSFLVSEVQWATLNGEKIA